MEASTSRVKLLLEKESGERPTLYGGLKVAAAIGKVFLDLLNRRKVAGIQWFWFASFIVLQKPTVERSENRITFFELPLTQELVFGS